MESKTENEQPCNCKKCFCARCFLPISPEDKVNVNGQNFHKMCSMCCICRQIPKSIKMFYGQVFCEECFKAHVLNRFKEPQNAQTNSCWMQWGPGMGSLLGALGPMGPMGPGMNFQAQGFESPQPQPQAEEKEKEKEQEKKTEEPAAPKCQPEEPPKKCICARCLQQVDDKIKIDIGGQSFHPQCARCFFCHQIPKDNVKIYYGQVFCEECFHRFVMARNKETPAEHFQSCFEQMQNNNQFAEKMKEFMATNNNNNNNNGSGGPFIFMMQGTHPPFCRCGNQPQAHEWLQANEPRKSAVTPATLSADNDSYGTWDLSFEVRTEISDLNESKSRESANRENMMTAAEKIEKLTKYLQDKSDSEKCTKKWKNFIEDDKFTIASLPELSDFPWVDLQDPRTKMAKACPRCLWQCGPIFVTSDYFQKVLYCGENFDE